MDIKSICIYILCRSNDSLSRTRHTRLKLRQNIPWFTLRAQKCATRLTKIVSRKCSNIIKLHVYKHDVAFHRDVIALKFVTSVSKFLGSKVRWEGNERTDSGCFCSKEEAWLKSFFRHLPAGRNAGSIDASRIRDAYRGCRGNSSRSIRRNLRNEYFSFFLVCTQKRNFNRIDRWSRAASSWTVRETRVHALTVHGRLYVCTHHWKFQSAISILTRDRCIRADLAVGSPISCKSPGHRERKRETDGDGVAQLYYERHARDRTRTEVHVIKIPSSGGEMFRRCFI